MTRAWLSRLQRISRLHHALRVRRNRISGNRKRALSLSQIRLREIATKAACARWYGDYERIPCPHCRGTRTYANGGRPGKPLARCGDCRRGWYVTSILTIGAAA
jgi:hypothetical protein